MSQDQQAALQWVDACATSDVDEEDVVGFEHAGRSYAVYHTASGWYATDGSCTHETALLCKGFVLGEVIECPRHQGRFHIPTGKARGAPACIDLRTHPVRVEGDRVLLGVAP